MSHADDNNDRRTVDGMDDLIDDRRQPHCPKCGGVLRVAARGYWCPGCELV